MALLASDAFTSALGPIWVNAREASATGGRARLACISAYGALETDRLYPIRDTTYTVELATRPAVGKGTTQAILEVAIDSENKLAIYIEAENLNLQEIHEGASTETTIAYEPTAHRWWRIRVEGTTVLWQTSPDGSAWTTRRTKTAAIDVDQIAEGRLLSGFYGEESGLSPAYAEFDNFSIDGPLFAPEAVTGAPAGPPLSRSAMLTGTVNPRLSDTSYYFEFGTTVEYGRRAPVPAADAGTGNDPVDVSQFVSGLAPATTYHYRLVAESAGGTDHGDDATFTTSAGIRVGGAVVDPVVRTVAFTGDEIADFHEVHEAPGAITEVPDPAGSGDTVFKLTVGDDDVFPVTPTDNPRAQMLSPDLIVPGGVYRLSGAFYLPADFPESTPAVGEENGFMSVLAYYGPPFAGTGPWEIAINGDPTASIMWQRNASHGFDIPWETPLVKEAWVHVELDFLFAREGWVELRIDGEPVTFFAPGSSYNPSKHEPTERLEMATRDSSNDSGPNHAKILNYRLRGMYESVTLYHRPLVLERMAPAAVR